MKEEQKIGLTEVLLGTVTALVLWLAATVQEVAKAVAALQVHEKDQDRRIERLEDASAYLPLSPLDGGVGLDDLPTIHRTQQPRNPKGSTDV